MSVRVGRHFYLKKEATYGRGFFFYTINTLKDFSKHMLNQTEYICGTAQESCGAWNPNVSQITPGEMLQVLLRKACLHPDQSAQI